MKNSNHSIVIHDTEYTSWPYARQSSWGLPGQHRELIQIAARRWTFGSDWQSGEVFYADIKPILNPALSLYIKKLTGIRQTQANEAKSAEKVLNDFSEFVRKDNCWANGGDINVLAETAGLQKFLLPLDPRNFCSLCPTLYCNVQEAIGSFDWNATHSGHFYKLLKIELPSDNVHNALHDVDSLCATINRLQELGVDMSYLWKSNPPNNPNNFKLSPKNLRLYEQQKTSKN